MRVSVRVDGKKIKSRDWSIFTPITSLGDPQKGFRHKNKFQDSQFNKLKSSNQPKTDQQKSLGQQPQSCSSVPKMSSNSTCPSCYKKHPGQCRAGQSGCYTCGSQGHISSLSKDCPLRISWFIAVSYSELMYYELRPSKTILVIVTP
ncbi:hypothetical protein F511_28133 [Dorcoceras hygrometricum]|uniref:CCHC-type domain-containing protein n=1 Tax=Dorcoceras hygrometricum TaxID=472368 RepID=A0A2Z7BAT2_9LAMI|nr:hypothetical protein F511_28133 [Dorcoceras hygrometricum]